MHDPELISFKNIFSWFTHCRKHNYVSSAYNFQMKVTLLISGSTSGTSRQIHPGAQKSVCDLYEVSTFLPQWQLSESILLPPRKHFLIREKPFDFKKLSLKLMQKGERNVFHVLQLGLFVSLRVGSKQRLCVLLVFSWESCV